MLLRGSLAAAGRAERGIAIETLLIILSYCMEVSVMSPTSIQLPCTLILSLSMATGPGLEENSADVL